MAELSLPFLPVAFHHQLSGKRIGRRARKSAFTLVELLVVLAVITILVSLVVGGSGSMNDGRKIDNAGGLLSNLATQARQMATSRNAMVMFVLAEDTSENYTLLTTLERPVGATTWKHEARWEKLPEGVHVDLDNSQIAPAEVDPLPFPLKHGVREINSADCRWIIFLPGGRLLGGTNALYEIRLSEKENHPNFYRVYINSITGIALTERP